MIEALIDHFSELCPNLSFSHHYASASDTPHHITITAENANCVNTPLMIMGLRLDGYVIRVAHHSTICGAKRFAFDLNRQEDLKYLEEMLVRTNAKAPHLS